MKEQLVVYCKLLNKTDESYVNLTLDDLLDVNDSFLHIDAREKDWSAIDLACCCKRCYKWTVCSHTTLVGMCFIFGLNVPGKWEQAEPSLRKARGRRAVGLGSGIAGVKR